MRPGRDVNFIKRIFHQRREARRDPPQARRHTIVRGVSKRWSSAEDYSPPTGKRKPSNDLPTPLPTHSNGFQRGVCSNPL